MNNQRIIPQGLQKEVVTLPKTGTYAVLGTAGSGKTIMALLRARTLSLLDPSSRILLIAFNTTLLQYFEAVNGEPLPENIDISNFYQFAVSYLSEKGVLEESQVLKGNIRTPEGKSVPKKNYMIQQAMEEESVTFDLSTVMDEVEWIQKMGIQDRISYLNAKTSYVEKGDRPKIWKVYDRYTIKRAMAGYVCDFTDMADLLFKTLERDYSERKYTHIVIDEGQDLSPISLRALHSAIPEKGSFIYFGDIAQQIYGSHYTWRDSGIEPSYVWKFTRNYRNPREISDFSLEVLDPSNVKQEEDYVGPDKILTNSSYPLYHQFKTREEEIAFIVNTAIQKSRSGPTAIFTRHHDILNQIDEILEEKKISAQLLYQLRTAYDTQAPLSIGTFFSSKGLEFDHIFLPGLDSMDRDEEEYAARLLFVVCTRAKKTLTLSSSFKKPEILSKVKQTTYGEIVHE